jgi:hypothetical protein
MPQNSTAGSRTEPAVLFRKDNFEVRGSGALSGDAYVGPPEKMQCKLVQSYSVVPDTLDLVLHQQLATLQLHYFETITRRVGHCVCDFVFERLVLSFKFGKVRVHGHMEWLLATFR